MHLLLNQGLEATVLDEKPQQAGQVSRLIAIRSDAVLVSLFAASVSGTLDVNVYAGTDGKEALLFSFPQLSAATSNLLLRRSSITPSTIRIEVIYSNAAEYTIMAKAVSAGSSDTKILGADSFRVSKSTVNTTAAVLIPAALTDRSGLVIKNWSTTQTVYLGESAGTAVAAVGYPLAPRDALAMDVAAGVEVYASSDVNGADVRIAESGG